MAAGRKPGVGVHGASQRGEPPPGGVTRPFPAETKRRPGGAFGLAASTEHDRTQDGRKGAAKDATAFPPAEPTSQKGPGASPASASGGPSSLFAVADPASPPPPFPALAARPGLAERGFGDDQAAALDVVDGALRGVHALEPLVRVFAVLLGDSGIASAAPMDLGCLHPEDGGDCREPTPNSPRTAPSPGPSRSPRP
jgi:hypothetical protein